MNDKIWNVVTEAGNESVTCEICGVAQDGSLLCFNIETTEQGNGPQVIRGYAPGQWKTFNRSTLRMN